MKDFLLEIGVEELPPNSLQNLSDALANNIASGLQQLNLVFAEVVKYATPRRLAVLIIDLASSQPERIIERRGPSMQVAFKNGKPTQAALGFAKSCNVEVKKLQKISDTKGDFLLYKQRLPGKKTELLLPEIVNNAVKKLPIAKLMRWNKGNFLFVRPVHWVVMLYGTKKIHAEILGVEANNKTFGHRFHSPKSVVINKPQEYTKILRNNFVMADFTERKKNINQQVTKLASKYGKAIVTKELLDEITGLVEWPVAMLGTFPEQYLKVPKEVLILSMQKHQKYFPVTDKKGKLLPYFIFISNIKSKKPKQVIAGNEKVLNARLSDAEFFYQSDLMLPLDIFLNRLNRVTFQDKLGSLYDKATRIAKLAKDIALNCDARIAFRAGSLAKADLMTKMVGEFPELQGIMGYYYALQCKDKRARESEEVALAIKEHYLPKFAGDELPTSTLGAMVAIADKIDTIIGIFGINNAPSGDKDPFGLRRAALGILRIIIEKKLDLDLVTLIQYAVVAYRDNKITLENPHTANEVLDFILDRLRAWCLEQGITPQVFAAVLARKPTHPLDFMQRLQAVTEFQQLPEAEALAIANKRVSNILKKIASIAKEVDLNLLQEPEEMELYNKIIATEKLITPLCDARDYNEAFKQLALLKTIIDAFFDHVLVMDKNEKLQRNRLALLHKLRKLFLHIADISVLQ